MPVVSPAYVLPLVGPKTPAGSLLEALRAPCSCCQTTAGREADQVSEPRAFWDQIRRGIMQLVNALAKTRPDDRYTLEVRMVNPHLVRDPFTYSCTVSEK